MYKYAEFTLESNKIAIKHDLPDISVVNSDLEYRLCDSRMNVNAEYTNEHKLRFQFDIQTQLDDELYDANIRSRLKYTQLEPTMTFGVDKIVYPLCDEDSKKCGSIIKGIYKCKFDTFDSNCFNVWVDRKKIDELYVKLVDIVDTNDGLIVGFVCDTALTIIGPPYDQFKIELYSTMELIDAIDAFKSKFREYTKHIYYKRNGDDDDALLIKIETKNTQ